MGFPSLTPDASNFCIIMIDTGREILCKHVEDVFIQAALRISDNNISKAARLLGINRNTLSRKLRVSEKT